MKDQIEVVYLDGEKEKFNVKSDQECDVVISGTGGEAIICTTEGWIIRLNWANVKSIRFYPAPRAKKEKEQELPLDESLK